jgi:hypothetical protein
MDMSDHIEQAMAAHRSVRADLRTSAVVLRRPSRRIEHRLNEACRLRVQHHIAPSRGLRWVSEIADEADALAAAVEAARGGAPSPQFDFEDGADHATLVAAVRAGEIPIGGGYDSPVNNPRHPPSLAFALQMARKRGYRVPQDLADRADRGVSFAERSAWHAAHAFVRHGAPGCVVGPDMLGRRLGALHLTGSHVVPDPTRPGKVPYVVDQLWIVAANEGAAVRLLALEIDGEHHLDPANANRDRRRDEVLEAAGYEVFRVAGWWCRIDPFKVVLEFMRAAGLVPGGVTLRGEPFLATIDDYACGICGLPMIRFDEDWIAEVSFHDDDMAVHAECTRNGNEEHIERSSRLLERAGDRPDDD